MRRKMCVPDDAPVAMTSENCASIAATIRSRFSVSARTLRRRRLSYAPDSSSDATACCSSAGLPRSASHLTARNASRSAVGATM